MNRFIPLLAVLIPYWIFIRPWSQVPFLNPGSLWPIVFAILSLALFVPVGWWIFRFDDLDRQQSWSRLGLGSIGGVAIVYGFVFGMANPGLAAKVFGTPIGLAMGVLGIGDAIKDVPSIPIWASIIGYTLGVGLTEELSKSIAARVDSFDGLWNRAGLGFASGIGFGVAEAVLYSYRDYAGHSDWTMYVVRFVFCVGFHGVMSSISVLFLRDDWWDFEQWWRTGLSLDRKSTRLNSSHT